MIDARVLAKRFLRRFAGVSLQARLRRWHLTRQTLAGHVSAEAEQRALPYLIRRGMVAMDVGANAGSYTVALSRLVGESGQVFAFEPIPDNYRILCNVIETGGLRNVTALELAVGETTGEVTMIVPATEDYTGYYLAHVAESSQPTENSCLVRMTSLDRFAEMNRLASVDFIKCDVEGLELQVLRGARGVISRGLPGALIEVSKGTNLELFELMKSWNYDAYVFAEKMIPVSAYRDGEFSNYFFFHPESRMGSLVPTLADE